jgi:hypothetical protein
VPGIASAISRDASSGGNNPSSTTPTTSTVSLTLTRFGGTSWAVIALLRQRMSSASNLSLPSRAACRPLRLVPRPCTGHRRRRHRSTRGTAAGPVLVISLQLRPGCLEAACRHRRLMAGTTCPQPHPAAVLRRDRRLPNGSYRHGLRLGHPDQERLLSREMTNLPLKGKPAVRVPSHQFQQPARTDATRATRARSLMPA